jgi:chaperonin cofactor prefoldin
LKSFVFVYTKFHEKESMLSEMMMTLKSIENEIDENTLGFMNHAISLLNKVKKENENLPPE